MLLAITSEEFSRLTPREAMEKMPWLVRAKLGERPAVSSPKNRPTYKVKTLRGSRRTDVVSLEKTPLDSLVAAESPGPLEDAIGAVRLTAGERAIIRLLCIEGLAIEEIARRRGISVRGVRMQRLRAAKKIERHLKATGRPIRLRGRLRLVR